MTCRKHIGSQIAQVQEWTQVIGAFINTKSKTQNRSSSDIKYDNTVPPVLRLLDGEKMDVVVDTRLCTYSLYRNET